MTSFKNTFFSLLALLLPLSINAEVKAKKKKPVNAATSLEIKNSSPFYAISHEYMKGYVTDSLEDNQEDLKAFEKKLRLAIPQIPTYTQYAKVYSLFSAVNVPGSSVFNKNSWDDLELLVGEHNQATNLMNFVDRTTTSFGKIYLSYMVATPIANVTVLKKRQAIINEFATNKKLSTNISKLLTKAKAAENNFFFLWQEETDFNFKAINAYFFSSTLPGLKQLRHANTNPYLMELLCIKGRLLSVGIAMSIPTIQFFINRKAYSVLKTGQALDAYKKDAGHQALNEAIKAHEVYEANQWGSIESFNRKFADTFSDALDKSFKKASAEEALYYVLDSNTVRRASYDSDKFITLVISHPAIMLPAITETFGAEFGTIFQKEAVRYQNDFLAQALQGASGKAACAVINQHNPFENKLKTTSFKNNDVNQIINTFYDLKESDPTQLTYGDFYKYASASGGKKPFLCFTGFVGFTEALTLTFAYSRENTYNKLTNYLHTQMLSAGTIIQVMQAINTEIKKNPTLAANLTHSQNLSALFAKTDASVSPKLRKLAQLLTTSTFKGQPSYFTLKGRVLAAYALMKEIKDELAPALVALGEVDALLSCAKLLEEGSNEPNHYTFATYIEQDTPFICMTNMWNPFVGPKKSVVNSIELGGKNPRNVILTGPNAGGKSTFSKGLTLNVVLAQTVGIVPAQSLTLTVFDKINTYMNITDDTAGGNSLFKSEVLRAQELLKTITGLDKAKFSFSVMDEMFSGTSPQEGQAASYAVAKNIGSQPNSIAVIATHFPRLKKLDEETTYFKNYQVRVVRHDNGTFSYPFKLEAGAADQNVAIDILQQQGFDMSILSDAHAILNETPANK